jgi:hypothetical protein
MKVTCTISIGELFDKITILRIKKVMIKDATKLEHINNELLVLTKELEGLNLSDVEVKLSELEAVNKELWIIEDDIRDKERERCFDERFIALARSVYVKNDERFQVKSSINNLYGSSLEEVKSYKKY